MFILSKSNLKLVTLVGSASKKNHLVQILEYLLTSSIDKYACFRNVLVMHKTKAHFFIKKHIFE